MYRRRGDRRKRPIEPGPINVVVILEKEHPFGVTRQFRHSTPKLKRGFAGVPDEAHAPRLVCIVRGHTARYDGHFYFGRRIRQLVENAIYFREWVARNHEEVHERPAR